MALHEHGVCGLCGADQDGQPLVQTAYRGIELFFCPPCFHSVLRGEQVQALAEKVRARRSQELNDRPLAKPGLRY